ncbi:hypothetical protein F0919_02655 [Taibaiella lutea]|uniref:Uncharacterized protein n=1 Tax=Taibaiella lutea TaxID=2608001 RepID=A0A5M6CMZ1_9BACT|nr:hypothetical protein [Taibaiella lutea]KAA5536588.1 hypothetical protein F0919_02655 [Taibaiella lutea]
MSGQEEMQIESLYDEYCAAINSGIIEDILRAGELYFTALHNGTMNEEDRERLQKDVLLCAARRSKV